MKTHYSKVRIGLVSILFVMTFVMFFARLFFVQVVRGEELRGKAERQYLRSIELPANRGEIYDSKGNKVAVNSTFKSIFAYPLSTKDAESSYRLMSLIFKQRDRNLRKQYKLTPKKFRWIKRGLTLDEFARFESCNNHSGLFLREEPSRTYPYGHVGAAILGFVDLDNCGKAGIELVMDQALAGSPGRSTIQTNGIGEEYGIQEVPIKEAQSGQSVVLTVDWDKQQIVEEELARAVKEHSAKGGMALFLDPHSGSILAAADCDSNGQVCDKPMKLETVTCLFEPGSVFKLLTAAAALEDGRIKPEDKFYAEKGLWRLGRRSLRDDHKHDTLTFREGFELSSNIVMGKIAYEIGGDRVFAMAQKFGFGRKVRCGLHGESAGVLQKPNRWSEFTTSTFAIGHGVSVTPLQMAQAFAMVAAGGYLCQPHFIAGCINDEGCVIERHTSRPIKILDDDIVAVLDSFMRGVVERGTGQPIGDAPFAIAGKTGTAEKPNLETGGYYKNKFMASFAGYFPADSPQVAGIVILDEPEPIHYGGYTAGPAFKEIAVKFAALDKYGAGMSRPVRAEVEDDYPDVGNDDRNLTEVPDLTGDSRGKAEYKLRKFDLKAVFSGSGNKVIGTRPAALTRLSAGQEVICYMSCDKEKQMIVPDLSGLTIREAVALLEHYGIAFTCHGKGRVVKQTPPAGDELATDEIIKLECERHKGV
jgi:stage V sporulation protein D (sporulation-specific penicillin-binding protein)